MAHEILSVKLCEMDNELSDFHSKIRISDQLSAEELNKEIMKLKVQLEESVNLAKHSLEQSRAKISSALLEEFDALGCGLKDAFEKITEEAETAGDPEFATEKKILTAEYNIDFAIIVARLALLKSLEAMLAEKQIESESK